MTDIKEPNLGGQKPNEFIKKIEKAFNRHHKTYISCIIGIAIAYDERTPYQSLFEKVDEALYISKQYGKGKWSVVK